MRQYKSAILFILLIALVVRVVCAWQWHQATVASGKLFRLGDSDSYWVLAYHVARGEPYQYGSENASLFRAPTYPIVLAPWTLVKNPQVGVWCARLMGCVLGTISVGLVMLIARRIGSREGALLAGVTAAIYPGAVGMSIVILSEAIFCPLMLLALYGWCLAMDQPSLHRAWRVCVLAGAATGIAILARPSWLLFMPFAGLVVLIGSDRSAVILRAKILVLMALACALVMAPWWLRNYRITHRFVPTTLQVGASLYDGLHQGASGGSDENMDFVTPFLNEELERDAKLREDAGSGSNALGREKYLRDYSTLEYRLNKRMQHEALAWSAENLSGVIRLSLIKFGRTWSLWPTAGEVGSTSLRLILTVSCLWVLLTAALGAWYYRSQAGCWIVVLLLPALYFTLLHMIFVGSIRYREPAMLVLTALSGCALGRWISVQRQTGKSSLEIQGTEQR